MGFDEIDDTLNIFVNRFFLSAALLKIVQQPLPADQNIRCFDNFKMFGGQILRGQAHPDDCHGFHKKTNPSLIFRVEDHLPVVIKYDASNFSFKPCKTFSGRHDELPDMSNDFRMIFMKNFKGMSCRVGS